MREQTVELWNNLDNRARIVIISAVVVSILALLIITNWAGQPNYVTLFSNLTTEDAGQIANTLDERQIDYQLSNDGREILVPESDVHRVRLDLASEGLPSGGVVGFEVFDETRLGSTDYEQRVNFYRALSGELTRSIMQLEDVEHARVQISAPEDSLYLDREQEATASVLLKLEPYASLETDQIRGIVNLVASGVEGLSQEEVTVVDSRGNLLSAQLEEETKDFSQASTDKFEVERNFESGLQSSLETMLSRVFGHDNVVVRVRANLNFDQRELQSKTFEPVINEEGIPRSQQSRRVEIFGDEDDSGGVPGTESNIPQYMLEEEEETEGRQYLEEDITTNYEINEQIENFVQSPGQVENLSVAVLVDSDLTEEQQQSINDAVAATIGYQEQRGDSISVSSFEFDRSLADEMTAEMEAAQAAQRRRWIIIGIITLLIVLIGALILRKILIDEDDIGEETPAGLDMMVDDGMAEQSAAVEEELSPEDKRRKEIKEEISQLVEEQPKEIARLLKTWLSED
ncbi:flagellar basal-body MS-ring/collar protein FliF [Fuchsiella alkaliacetigena]|uniref:flagellar basal-body MS-ring/collar protein FliF n=1 Tax=Fuchsiella alkaliacetigena TaxID=957042 RepID=UPI00200A53C2|nr:flagellar basal-body MS-ring/collar protein FliF [Fuchsiella alkaliacetigena]MCK8823555.1 flagellar M-ring protein FliF [Fuchsiella alkaliacetigena]